MAVWSLSNLNKKLLSLLKLPRIVLFFQLRVSDFNLISKYGKLIIDTPCLELVLSITYQILSRTNA